MLRGLYSVASGMNVQQTKMDVITHNLANINTNGYKKDEAVQGSFAEVLITQRDGDKNKKLIPLGISSRGVILEKIHRDFSQGPLKETGKSTDLALQGEGFFVIEKGQEQVYTRDGCFTFNEEGCLVTAKGDPVLGVNGRIHLDGSDFVVKPDGVVIENGQLIDRLKIVTFDELQKLQKDSDNYFKALTETGKRIVDTPQVHQGYQEGANLVLVDEMLKMMEVSKFYDSNHRLIQIQDQLLEKSANEVGSVK